MQNEAGTAAAGSHAAASGSHAAAPAGREQPRSLRGAVGRHRAAAQTLRRALLPGQEKKKKKRKSFTRASLHKTYMRHRVLAYIYVM